MDVGRVICIGGIDIGHGIPHLVAGSKIIRGRDVVEVRWWERKRRSILVLYSINGDRFGVRKHK